MGSYAYESPVWLRLSNFTATELSNLQDDLTYESAQIREELRRLKNSPWMEAKMGREAWIEAQEDLEEKLNICLVECDKQGYKILSGFANRLNREGWKCLRGPVTPEEGLIPFEQEQKPPRYYQTEMVKALIAGRHACISAATGTGKSWVIARIVRELSVRTVIMAPSKNIAGQLYDDLVDMFGKKRVGLVGDGKRDYKKQIVIGIAGSLSNIADEPDCDEYKVLSKAELFIVDESHQTAAATFARVAQKLMINAWYRFFLSATQFRNDGADIFLEGLTGPQVYDYPLEKAVAEGFLAAPEYVVFDVGTSPRRSYSNDIMEMTRMHFYSNPELHRKMALIMNNFLDSGYTTMVLIEEMQQFNLLLPHLTWAPVFAHAAKKKEDLAKLPEPFRKPDVKDIVRRFNAGEHKLLIGTSCIGTGTDTRPVDALFYLQGGRSEIQVSQGRGRGTRLVPGKTKFFMCDVMVRVPGLESDKDPMIRHIKSRIGYYGGAKNVKIVPVP